MRVKLRKALGGWPAEPFGDALEIGAGTGYFSLNLLQIGLIERATATDISPGMLKTLRENATDLGLKVKTVEADAEQLPFDDESFDLVFGHAVLHHIPDLERGFAEFKRVLRPGGTLAFCGEPSRYGDLLAALPKRSALLAAPLWRRSSAPRSATTRPSPTPTATSSSTTSTSTPSPPATCAGSPPTPASTRSASRARSCSPSMHGWTMRTLEGSAVADAIPWGWKRFAFRSYIALQRLDNQLLEPHLPPQLFYNLLVSARKP